MLLAAPIKYLLNDVVAEDILLDVGTDPLQLGNNDLLLLLTSVFD
jgi:hypothetical protein